MDKSNKKMKWTVKAKYILITGATSGIGLAAAKELAAKGANLGIIARNQEKAKKVANEIRSMVGENITIDIFIADMASQKSIRNVAEDILNRCPKIDILINNAGALYEKHELTEEGHEMTWAVNYLAPFLLNFLVVR